MNAPATVEHEAAIATNDLAPLADRELIFLQGMLLSLTFPEGTSVVQASPWKRSGNTYTIHVKLSTPQTRTRWGNTADVAAIRFHLHGFDAEALDRLSGTEFNAFCARQIAAAVVAPE